MRSLDKIVYRTLRLIDSWLALLILWSISIRCILLTVMVPLDYRNTFMIRWCTGISHSKRYWLQLRSFDYNQGVLIGRTLQLLYLWPWPMWLMGGKADCGFSGVVWDPRLSQMCKPAVQWNCHCVFTRSTFTLCAVVTYRGVLVKCFHYQHEYYGQKSL